MAINVWKATTGSGVNISSEVIIATAGQTVFNLTSISYTPDSESLQVYVNGVNQIAGASNAYVETDSTTVTFTAGLDTGDEVRFMTFG